MKPLIIYHNQCDDGFACATIAWKVFRKDAEYCGRNYKDRFETLPSVKNRDVYILDFSFKWPEMMEIFNQANKVIWLDHHITMKELITQNEIPSDKEHLVIHDEGKCGAILTWEYFFPYDDLPEFFKFIDDQDRWQFKFEETKPFTAWLRSNEYNFESWVSFIRMVELFHLRQEIINVGKILLNTFKKNVDEIIKSNKTQCELEIEGQWNQHYDAAQNSTIKKVRFTNPQSSVEYYRAITESGLACNATYQYASDIGSILSKESKTFGLVWFVNSDLSVSVSLRSVGDYNVAEIAKYYGGGGHKNAAGFVTDLETLKTILKG